MVDVDAIGKAFVALVDQDAPADARAASMACLTVSGMPTTSITASAPTSPCELQHFGNDILACGINHGVAELRRVAELVRLLVNADHHSHPGSGKNLGDELAEAPQTDHADALAAARISAPHRWRR